MAGVERPVVERPREKPVVLRANKICIMGGQTFRPDLKNGLVLCEITAAQLEHEMEMGWKERSDGTKRPISAYMNHFTVVEAPREEIYERVERFEREKTKPSEWDKPAEAEAESPAEAETPARRGGRPRKSGTEE